MDHSRAHSRGFGQTDSSGRGPWGFIVTILIGMAGALVGGLIVGLSGGSGVTGFNIWSILVAAVGAIVVLAVYRLWGAP